MKNLFVLTSGIVFLSGCSHHLLNRGTVESKLESNKVQVCLEKNSAKVGSKVSIYKNVCEDRYQVAGHQIPRRICKREKVGGGTVLELINEHHSIVSLEEGVPFLPGAQVELN